MANELKCPFRNGKCKPDCVFVYKFDNRDETICGIVLLIDNVLKNGD